MPVTINYTPGGVLKRPGQAELQVTDAMHSIPQSA